MSWRRYGQPLDGKIFHILEERIRLLEHKLLGSSDVIASSSVSDGGKADSDVSSIDDRGGMPALTVLRRHVVDFWNNISLPGFKYVGEPGRHRSDRFIWIVVLLLSLFVSSKYIGDAYKKWQGSPVLLSFNDSLTPISLIPFPAVTFCPARRISEEVDLEELLQRCEVDNDCDQNETQLLSAARLLCPKSKYLNVTGGNDRNYNSSLEDYIEEVATTCGEVIEWFKFSLDDYYEVEGNSSLCGYYFQTLYGDGSSVCFTFNMLPARDMFNPNVTPPVIDKTVFSTKARWSPDSMLKSADMGQTIPRYIDSNGRWSGLYIGMTNFTANESGVCGKAKSEARLFFHHPAELPLYQIHDSVDLPEHKELFLRLQPAVVTASEELDGYTPVNRRCYFSHEKPLSLFTTYTQRNCQLECRVNCSLSLCDCVPFYLPRINNSVKICGKEYRTSCSPFLITGILEGRFTWKDILMDFKKHTGQRVQQRFEGYETTDDPTGKILTEDVLNSTYPACTCDCPAACTTLRYEVRIEEGDPLDPSLSTHFSRAAVSFKELEVTSVIRKELIGLTDFIANSGGVLGVFTGFSFLALCELAYYLTLRLWSSIKHAYDPMEQDRDPPSTRKDQLKCCFCCGPVVGDVD